MPRALRIEYENAWYHVINRGAGHRNIFTKNKHRQIFLDCISEAVTQYNIECHAYCLMGNHYHLLLKTPLANLSQTMRHINGVYTQRYNRLEKSDGPIFRGRYKSILVEENEYLLHLSRYIHLNPIKARGKLSAAEYPWSSCQYYVGANKPPSWLMMSFILTMLSKRNQYQAYAKFLADGVDKMTEDFYTERKQPVILGTDGFKEKVLLNVTGLQKEESSIDFNKTVCYPTIRQICDSCCEHFQITPDNLTKSQRGTKNLPRKFAIYASRRWGLKKLKDIAKYFKLGSLSAASEVIREIEFLRQNNDQVAQELNVLQKRVSNMLSFQKAQPDV